MKGPARRRPSRPTAGATGRTLTVNIGNTSLFCGVFQGTRLVRSFRLPAAEFATLARRVGGAPTRAAICSVVPSLTASVLRLIRQTWQVEAQVLTAEGSHGLRIGYRRPSELGTDRLAAAIAAHALLPTQNVLVVDCGTATTVTALRRDGTLPGGAIFPGPTLWSEMLARRTAQLPMTRPRRPRHAVGRSPAEAIVGGIYFGQTGAIRETADRVRRAAFGAEPSVTIATGGNAALFAREGLFDRIEPALVLIGLNAFARASSPA